MNNNILFDIYSHMVIEDITHNQGNYYIGAYGVFNCESLEQTDVRVTVFKNEGVELKVCHGYGYFEILGLSDEDFKTVKRAYRNYAELLEHRKI